MQTIAPIIKNSTYPNLETELIVFNNQLLEIGFIRAWGATCATKIRITDYFTGALLAENPWTGGMGCAIVKDGVIHIFGNTNWAANGNKIIHSTLDIDFTPSSPIDAMLPNSPMKFYNTSITQDANGYRAVVETTTGVYFAKSTDLNTWTYYGGQLAAGQYCGCPTIDFINGTHYLTYLKSAGGKYVTQVAKSTDDCFTFTYFNGNAKYPSGSYLLVPEAERDGINASDASFVEFNGTVYGCYLNGDQSTWADYKKFSYNGTLQQLFAEFFP